MCIFSSWCLKPSFFRIFGVHGLPSRHFKLPLFLQTLLYGSESERCALCAAIYGNRGAVRPKYKEEWHVFCLACLPIIQSSEATGRREQSETGKGGKGGC